MVGESIYVKSVEFVVRSQACSRNTYERTRMCDPTCASAATLLLKLKVGFTMITFKLNCKRLG